MIVWEKNNSRSAIPAELRRKVLVEAGHRCAIPTCRHIEVDVHHIIPWEKCRKHEYENLIALCPNCHRRADRGDIDKKSLRVYKNNLRYIFDKYSQFEMDVLFDLSRQSNRHPLPFPSYLSLLIKRLLDSGFVRVQQSGSSIKVGPVKINPDYILITDKGRVFVNSISSGNIGY